MFQQYRSEHKWFRVFVWNIANGIVASSIAYFTDNPGEWWVALLIVFNMITKEINKRLLDDLGVIKEEDKNLPYNF